MVKGVLFGVGVGPGDPDLLTIKAYKAIQRADVIAYHETSKKQSNALKIISNLVRNHQILLPLTYPVTTEFPSDSKYYADQLNSFYSKIGSELASYLEVGSKVAVLAEGDPLFYSSFMYICDELKSKFEIQIIPGISSIFAGAAALQLPLCYRNEKFTVVSAVPDERELENSLNSRDAFVIMKIGRNFAKLKRVLLKMHLIDRAHYIERVTMTNQKIIPINEVKEDTVPYFSLIYLPGNSWRLS